MKIRTDFVSNSSSSSFIVKDEGIVDGIFVKKNLSWEEYATRFFHREVADCYIDACDAWFDCLYSHRWSSSNKKKKFDLKSKVTVMSDADFVEIYKSGKKLPYYVILERDVKMLDEISKAIELARAIDREKSPIFMVNGKKDEAAMAKWQSLHWNRKKDAEDVVSNLVSVITTHMVDLLDEAIGGWKFWYAELGDDNGSENMGHEKISEYNWHRVFSNH